LFTVAVALVVGLPLGLAAGFVGGRVDDLIMRAVEVILSFPTLVLALGITAILGPKLIHALFAIGVVFVPHFARLIRGQVLAVKENDFVAAATALGAPLRRVSWRCRVWKGPSVDRWLMLTIVVPGRRARSSRYSSASEASSSAEVASSRKSHSGRCTRARAKAMRCASPGESTWAQCPISS